MLPIKVVFRGFLPFFPYFFKKGFLFLNNFDITVILSNGFKTIALLLLSLCSKIRQYNQ